MTDGSDLPICHRCGALMQEKGPLFFMVNIEAYPLPDMLPMDPRDIEGDLKSYIEQLMDEMRGLSEQELLDQVYRRLSILLCPICYHQWIENPTPVS